MSPRIRTCFALSFLTAGVAALTLSVGVPGASAATPPVGLGTAASYAVLAGSAVTNTGSSVIDGDLGVSPGTAISGFPPGVLNGVQHAADAAALQAQNDLVTAYNDAAGRGPDGDKSNQDLGGQRLTPGVYRASSSMALTGTLTLDALGDPDAIFVLQAGSSLITATGSAVSLVGSAQPCNVYWQVGSDATLGTSTRFVGTLLVLTSATLNTSATLEGRVLARDGAVTLDSNRITRPSCATRPTATPSAAPATTAPAAKGKKSKSGAKKSDKSDKATPKSSSPAKATKPTKPTATTSSSDQTTAAGDDTPAGGETTDSTTSSDESVPVGHPDTGMTPSARSTSLVPRALGGTALLLLLAAGTALAVGSRRRPRVAGRHR